MTAPHGQPGDPLHGVTLERMLNELVDHLGWEAMGKRVAIRCFTSDPSISSSLKFLRKTPWAREKVEGLYLSMLRERAKQPQPPSWEKFPSGQRAGEGNEMSYEVTVADVAARPTAVVAATTTWKAFPALWKGLLDEVWACLRAGGIDRGCPNVMLYLDDVPHVEVGVELGQPCALTGRVVRSALPAGKAAATVHHGPYAGLASAHRAVIDWCAAHGRRLAGPRWEVYGPHRDDPTELRTEVYYLLS